MTKTYPTVVLSDETLRDGLQIEREGVTVEQKLALLELLVDAGVRRLVVGAFVNPKWSPQMADTLEVVRRLTPRPGVDYLALALNPRGADERARWSPPLTVSSIPQTHLYMCDIFITRNTNRTIAAQERTWRGPIERARAAGAEEAWIGLSAPWGSNWRGPFTHHARMAALQKQSEAWIAEGIKVTGVVLTDPMGWNTPKAVADDIEAIRERFPTIKTFHLHLHNARGMAVVSAWEAIRVLDEGYELILDASLGGIGGCPYCGNGQATGMIPLEDLVQLLQTLGIETGIRIDKLIVASDYLSNLLRRQLSSQVAKNGPLPEHNALYDRDLPVLYTFAEARHFDKGLTVIDPSRPRPWLTKCPPG
jgi:hydroxymethylglutaryl-CoA lyase